jgi:hypothetical protein
MSSVGCRDQLPRFLSGGGACSCRLQWCLGTCGAAATLSLWSEGYRADAVSDDGLNTAFVAISEDDTSASCKDSSPMANSIAIKSYKELASSCLGAAATGL